MITQPMGPRKLAFSADPHNAVVAIPRRSGPTSVWLGRFGLLFSTKGKIIAAYYPDRNIVVHDPLVEMDGVKLVAQWALDMKVHSMPFAGEEGFVNDVLSAIAAFADAVDKQYNPRG